MTLAAQYEDKRCGYLRQQMSRLLIIRERKRSKNHKQNKDHGNENDENDDNDNNDYSDAYHSTYLALQASTLATLMKDIYQGLTDHGHVHCRFGSFFFIFSFISIIFYEIFSKTIIIII